MPSLLTVGGIAERAGISADTVRYYQRLGVLPKAARTTAGYRQYPETVLTRIALVHHAQRFGFSLHQIARFLRVRDAGGAPCREVRAAAQHLVDAADRHIDELLAAREQMRATLREWDQRLANTPAGTPARLLEHLTIERGQPASRLKRRAR